MRQNFLKSKLHRATVTTAAPDYEGSISLDRALCREARLREFEQVDVYNITNGAAARLVQPGDRVIVAAGADLAPEEVAAHTPRVVLLGERNVIQSVQDHPVTLP